MKKVRENFFEKIISYFFLDAPSFPLSVFPTNTNVTSSLIQKRWKTVIHHLSEEGIDVKFIASDGAPAFLGGMKLCVNFGHPYVFAKYTFPFDPLTELPCIQDTTHLLNKLKLRLFDDLVQLWMGNCLASGSHLKMLVTSSHSSKLEHCLNMSDVSSSDKTKDKMNFRATKKIFDSSVIQALHGIHGSKGTIAYLELMSKIYHAFMSPATKTSERLFNAFYVVSFLRRWRKFLKHEMGLNANNFITTNAWHCLEISAGFLLRLALKEDASLVPISDSQKCEGFFRNMRSFSSSGLTNINFTVYDGLMKINRIQTLETLIVDLKGKGIELKPSIAEENEQTEEFLDIDGQCMQIQDNGRLSLRECEEIIASASMKAGEDCSSLGINFRDEVELAFFSKVSPINIWNETVDHNQMFHDTFECEYEIVPFGEIQPEKIVKVGNFYFRDQDSGKVKFFLNKIYIF